MPDGKDGVVGSVGVGVGVGIGGVVLPPPWGGTAFSTLAVLISIIGVFGLVLFETQYRRREIGIRKVHGASVGDILRLFNTNFVRIVATCFVVAAPVAWYFVVQWQAGFAFRPPVRWWVFATALASVLAITMFTVTLQSYRAATENPVNSMKAE